MADPGRDGAAARRLAPVVRLAPAKLNLTLAVVGRRPDGYHDLRSVMVPLGLADRLSVARAAGPADTLHVAGLDAGPIADNLALRAISAARTAVGRAVDPAPLAARLEKRIPVAAGLAGGSSDAAAAIDAALEAWGVEDADPGLRHRIAIGVGSDVPFFLAAGPALVEGRGERVTPLPGIRGSAPAILLVTPAVPLSTAAAFAALDAGGAASATDPRSTRLTSEHLATELRAGLTAEALVSRAGVLASANDLLPAAAVLVPGLVSLRRALTRTLGRPIGLSGSGPTLWVLYPSLETAELAAAGVRAALASGEIAAPGEAAPAVIATTIGSHEPHGRPTATEDRT